MPSGLVPSSPCTPAFIACSQDGEKAVEWSLGKRLHALRFAIFFLPPSLLLSLSHRLQPNAGFLYLTFMFTAVSSFPPCFSEHCLQGHSNLPPPPPPPLPTFITVSPSIYTCTIQDLYGVSFMAVGGFVLDSRDYCILRISLVPRLSALSRIMGESCIFSHVINYVWVGTNLRVGPVHFCTF